MSYGDNMNQLDIMKLQRVFILKVSSILLSEADEYDQIRRLKRALRELAAAALAEENK
jgi:hypothetical protein